MTRATGGRNCRSGNVDIQATEGEGDAWFELNTRLAGTDPQDAQALRDAVALVYEAAAQTFEPLLQEFEVFSEAELARGGDTRAARVARGEIAVTMGAETKFMF